MMTKVKQYQHYRTEEEYQVSGITNETDEEIIKFCCYYALDGQVYRHSGDKARVVCDIG